MTKERPSPEELDAQFAPGTPAVAAIDWVNRFLAGGLRPVWSRTDPDLRLAMAQGFILANGAHPQLAGRDRDRLAARIVRADHADAWALEVIGHLGDGLRRGLPAWLLERRCGVPSGPRPVTPGYEEVLLVETDDGRLLLYPGEWLRTRALLLHDTPEGWLLASFDRQVPVPGWPPG